MSLKILYHNDILLRTVSERIAPGYNLSSVVDMLKDAIRYEDKVWTGCGLSICGVQIGLPLRVILIGRPLYWNQGKHHKAFDVIVNPEVSDKSQEIAEEWEGCLSIPDTECLVSRSRTITLKYSNLQGKLVKNTFENTMARVLQHEIDHLDGILMTDKSKALRKKQDHTK